MPVPIRLLLAATLVVGLGVACSNGSNGASDAAPPDFQGIAVDLPAEDIAAGLCRAATEALEDPASAKDTFFARSHDGLHDLARELLNVDRTASADLLVAKEAVEAQFSRDAPGAELGAGLIDLFATTKAGLARLGISVPACEVDRDR